MIICNGCKISLPESEFHRRGDKYHRCCKQCQSEYYKEWYRRRTKTCQRCGGPRSYRSKEYCLDCWNEIQAEKSAKKNYCMDCGVEITRQAKRCRKCASKITWADPEMRKRISERKTYEWQVGIMKGHLQPDAMKEKMSRIMKERYRKDE